MKAKSRARQAKRRARNSPDRILVLVCIVPAIWAVLALVPASAEYNANIQGTLRDVLVYTDMDHILFRFVNQPTSHPACSPNYFAIDASVPAERRAALYARLMTAYSLNEVVNIGYDDSGNCANGYIRVHRVG
jgi:hypothetical protein